MQVLRKIIVSLLSKCGSIFTVFLLTLYVSNLVSVEEAGKFFYAFALVSVLSVIIRYGYDNVIIRYLTTKEIGSSKNVSVVIYPFLFSLITSVLVFLSEYWFSIFSLFLPLESELLYYSIISSFFLSLSITFSFILQAKLSIFTASLFNNFLVNIIFLFLCFLINISNAEDLLFCYSISALITLLLSAFWVFYVRRFTISTEFSLRKSSFSVAFALWQVALMQQVVVWSSQLLSGVWLDDTDLAVLSVSQRISLLISFVLVAVNYVTAPMYSKYFHQDRYDLSYKLYLNSVKVLFIVGILITLIILLSFNYYSHYFGEILLIDEAFLVLCVLSIGQFVNLVTGSVGFILSLSGNERQLRNALFITTTVGLVCSLYFIPEFGLLGAAISTCLNISLQNTLALILVIRLFRKAKLTS